MLTDRHFPYSSMQEINLDWILTKVKNILRFVPDDGAVGQILRRTAHGAEWSNEQGGGGGAVTSVNGQTGDVILSIPTDTSDLNNDSGFVDAAGAAAAAPVQKVNGQTGTVTINKTAVGLGNVQNVLQYSASNPPPYPVTSVNTQTGDVVLSIPTDVSDLNNDSGFVDAAGAAAAAPVQSVNGLTGAVVLPAWTQIGSASGSSPVAISNQYTLFSIDAQYGNSSVYFPLSVTYAQLGSTAKLFTVGYYINATTNGFCQFSVSDSQVSILALYINGVNYTNTSTLRVFGL